jgi:hypothetical protein
LVEQIGGGHDSDDAFILNDRQRADGSSPHQIGRLPQRGCRAGTYGVDGNQMTNRDVALRCRAPCAAKVAFGEDSQEATARHDDEMTDAMLTHHVASEARRGISANRDHVDAHDISESHGNTSCKWLAGFSKRPETPAATQSSGGRRCLRLLCTDLSSSMRAWIATQLDPCGLARRGAHSVGVRNRIGTRHRTSYERGGVCRRRRDDFTRLNTQPMAWTLGSDYVSGRQLNQGTGWAKLGLRQLPILVIESVDPASVDVPVVRASLDFRMGRFVSFDGPSISPLFRQRFRPGFRHL